jgi:hypothetical protein
MGTVVPMVWPSEDGARTTSLATASDIFTLAVPVARAELDTRKTVSKKRNDANLNLLDILASSIMDSFNLYSFQEERFASGKSLPSALIFL